MSLQYGQNVQDSSNTYPAVVSQLFNHLIKSQYQNLMKDFKPGGRVFSDNSSQLIVAIPEIEKKTGLEQLIIGNYEKNRFVYQQELKLNNYYQGVVNKRGLLSTQVQHHFKLPGSNQDQIVRAGIIERDGNYHIQGQFLVKNYQLTSKMIEDSSKWVEKRDPFTKMLSKCLASIFDQGEVKVDSDSLTTSKIKKYYKTYEERRA